LGSDDDWNLHVGAGGSVHHVLWEAELWLKCKSKFSTGLLISHLGNVVAHVSLSDLGNLENSLVVGEGHLVSVILNNLDIVEPPSNWLVFNVNLAFKDNSRLEWNFKILEFLQEELALHFNVHLSLRSDAFATAVNNSLDDLARKTESNAFQEAFGNLTLLSNITESTVDDFGFTSRPSASEVWLVALDAEEEVFALGDLGLLQVSTDDDVLLHVKLALARVARDIASIRTSKFSASSLDDEDSSVIIGSEFVVFVRFADLVSVESPEASGFSFVDNDWELHLVSDEAHGISEDLVETFWLFLWVDLEVANGSNGADGSVSRANGLDGAALNAILDAENVGGTLG
jgi:hypothetical protein